MVARPPRSPALDEMLRLSERALQNVPPSKGLGPQAVTPLPGLRVVRYPVRTASARAVSVSTTAFDVGYESLSQFSREYSRRFGRSPNQDLVGSSAQK